VPKTHRHPTDKTDKRGRDTPETHRHPTDRTDKSGSVGSVGPQVGHSAEKRRRALTPTEQRAEAAKYPSRGWLLIWSEHLQEVVVLARDEQAAAEAPAGYVTYTEAEIEHLRDITPDALRQVHEAKKFWNGRITSKEATTGERRDIHSDGTAQTGAGH
jgi:hypothetical protein